MAAYSLEFWNTIIPHLEKWSALSLEQRRTTAYLPLTYHLLGKIWMDLPESLLDFLFEKGSKNQERLHRPTLEFKKLLSLQTRLDLWSRSTFIDATAYIHACTTHIQRCALVGLTHGYAPETVVAALAKKINFGAFAKTFLASENQQIFIKNVANVESKEVGLTAAHFTALKDWLAKVTEKGSVFLPLNSQTFQPYAGDIPVGEMIYLAQNYALAIVVKVPATLDVMLYVPAPVESLTQTTDKIKVQTLKPASTFSRPYLLDDMEVYLRSLKANPPFPLSDGISIAVAHHRKVAKQFLDLPGPHPQIGFEGEDRAKAAWWMISVLKLVSLVGDRRKAGMFKPNPDGEAWLKLPREKKLELVLTKAPCGQRKSRVTNENDLFSWLGDFQSIPFPYHALTNRVFNWMDIAFSHLDEPAAFMDWIKNITTKSNPFIADTENSPELLGYWGRWYATPENAYSNLLTHYVARLNSLGALALIHDSVGNLGITLTPIGHWLFGLSQSWSLPAETRAIAVVGADFSILLTEPSPGLAVELAGFAEVMRPGLSFRLTRRSVQEAVHHGFTADDILSTLKACAKTSLPANVMHEISAWSGTKQSVHVSEAVLVEGHDPITMAEILSSFPKEFVSISPTALKYIGGGKLTVLEKKLTSRGFYID